MFYTWRRSLSPSELRKVNRKRQPRRASRNHFVPYLEQLESRDCPSTIVNLSKMFDNQSDATIAINPANPQQIFVASTSFHGGYDGGSYYAGPPNSPPLTNGLFFGYSSNGGTSWTTGIMATGTDDTEPGYGLPAAGHFPHAAFDQYGNLFLTYVTDAALFRGTGYYDSSSCTLTDNNANWFTNEWSNVTSPTGGGTSAYTVFIGNAKYTGIGSNTAHTLNACATLNGRPLPSGTYPYFIRNGNNPQFFANSIVVAQSIDGGTFSSQGVNFTLLTFLGAFAGSSNTGPLIPLVATGPGFNSNAFAGQSTGSNSSTTLNDTNQNSWPANKFANWIVTITEGLGAGQTRTISSNTNQQLGVTSAWSTIPDATSSFVIAPLTGTSSGGNTSTTLNDNLKTWITNQFATELVSIISGTGAGQTRSIASNTSTQLTVTSAWSTIPDTTSQYEVAPVSGTSTGSNTSTTLNDSRQNWTSNLVGDIVEISEGTGAQEASVITAVNSSTQLTVSPAWGVVPNSTSSYLLGPKSGSVWVAYELPATGPGAFKPFATGAATYGLGLGAFGLGTQYVTSFYPPITTPNQESSAGQSGLAVGPGGQVLTSWVGGATSTANVETAVAGGLVSLQFTAPTVAATTYMGGGGVNGSGPTNYGSIPALGKLPAPTLSQTSGGTLPAATYYVQVAYVFGGPDGPASLENNPGFAVSANNLLQVSSPASGSGATGYNVYAATAHGNEVLQNTSPVALGATWTEPTTGLVTGTATPTQVAMNVDAAPQVAYDTDPSSSHYGRAYLVYTNSAGLGSADTNIFAKYSDNNGISSWTAGNSGNPVDDDTGHNSQFWPQAAVDPTTGKLAVSWYDARNDPGNVLVQIYSAVSSDGAGSFAANQQITAGQTNGAIAYLESTGTITSESSNSMTDSNQLWTTTMFPPPPPNEMDWWKFNFTVNTITITENTKTTLSLTSSPPAVGTRYTIGPTYSEAVGRYTGLAFYNGQLWPAWADNSNSTGDNPNRNKGTSANVWQLNIYTVNVTVSGPMSPSRAAALVSGPAGSQPLTSRRQEAARDFLLASIVQPTDALATSTPSTTADPAPQAAEQARTEAVQQLVGSLKSDDHPVQPMLLSDPKNALAANTTNLLTAVAAARESAFEFVWDPIATSLVTKILT